MIDRRFLLAATPVIVAFPYAAFAQPSNLKLTGPLEQGSLVLGKTLAGANVTLDGQKLHVADNGNFAFGFAYDQTKPATIVATYDDGKSEAQILTPIVRHYDIQRITGLPEKFVTLPPAVLERRKTEIAMIVAARKDDSDSDWFDEPFDWPADGVLSGTFGSQRILNGEPKEPHFGVDIAAAIGTSVHAPAAARVALAQPDFYLEGGLTILDHGHGVNTCYLHQSKLLVKAGDTVTRGQEIGLVGMKGRATGPHLHWGMNWFQMRLDPSRSTRTPAPAKA
jgi:murein DD-endopeptidase MepM/ murein hydrolase activator NlpD